MTTVTIKADTTIGLKATLPRDLTDADVVAHVGEEPQTVPCRLADASNGVVEFSLAEIDVTEGLYELEFEITFANGAVETLPADGYDHLKVVADLG